MKPKLELSNEEREILKNIVEAHVFVRIFDWCEAEMLEMCGQASNDQRYFQGILKGMRDFKGVLERFKDIPREVPVETPYDENETPVGHLRSGRRASGGI